MFFLSRFKYERSTVRPLREFAIFQTLERLRNPEYSHKLLQNRVMIMKAGCYENDLSVFLFLYFALIDIQGKNLASAYTNFRQ